MVGRARYSITRGARAHYADAAYYDHAYRDRTADVSGYVAMARRSGGPVLEYGAGTGRIAIPVARAGIEVVAVDLSPPMIARFRQKLARELPEVRKRVRIVRGDMRSVRFRRRFPLILSTFNTLLHLHERSDFERFLERVRAHLAPNGRFVFDVSMPDPEFLGADPERHFGWPRLRHPTTGKTVRYTERFDHDPIAQLLVTWMEFTPPAGARWEVPLAHRQLYPREIEALLHYNGFSDVRLFDGFSARPPGRHTETLVVTARLAKSRRRS